MRFVVVGVLAAVLPSSPNLSQSTSGSGSDLPDRFQVDTGYFRLSADTRLRYNGTSDVSFEKDLGVDKDVNTFSCSYDRGILVSELGGEITDEGFQVFVSFLF